MFLFHTDLVLPKKKKIRLGLKKNKSSLEKSTGLRVTESNFFPSNETSGKVKEPAGWKRD